MQKIHIIIYCLIIFVVSKQVNAQEQKDKRYLIFKIKYWDKEYVGCILENYLIISIEKFKSIKTIDTSQFYPNIIYNILINGGLYLTDGIDIYVYGCCEYRNIELGIVRYYNGELSEEQIKKYNKSNTIDMSFFDSIPCMNFIFEKWPAIFEINVWLADLEFCVCPLYMQNPPVKIYPYLGAYIIEIKSINKPDNKVRKKMKKILKRTIKVDVKNIKKHDGF